MQPHEAGGADFDVFWGRHSLSDPSSSSKRYRLAFVDSNGISLVLGYSISLCRLLHARCWNDSLVDPNLLPDIGVPEYHVWL